MLALLLSFLSLVSQEPCHLKVSNVPALETEKLAGVWYALLGTPKAYTDSYSCYTSEYIRKSDNELTTLNYYFDIEEQKWINYTARVTVDKNIFHWDTYYSTWTHDYVVLAVDYDRYLAVGGCVDKFNPDHTSWIYFRDKNPSSEVLQDLANDLKANNISLTDYIEYC